METRLTAAPAPARRRRRTSDEVNDRILRAARIAFTEGGYAGATTAAIARLADVTEAQLYRGFGSKAALFREAVFKPLNDHFADFQRRIAGGQDAASDRDRAADYIVELQRFLADNAGMLLALVVNQRHSADDTVGLQAIDSLAAYFDTGAATMRERGRSDTVSPEIMVRVSFAAVLGYVLFADALFPPGWGSRASADAALRGFVVDGIGAGIDPC